MLLYATDTFMVSDRQGELEAGRMDTQQTDRSRAHRDRLPPDAQASSSEGGKVAPLLSNNYRRVSVRARKVKAGLDENHFHWVLMAS